MNFQLMRELIFASVNIGPGLIISSVHSAGRMLIVEIVIESNNMQDQGNPFLGR